MLEIYPDYYSEFKCIAGACNHTCCAGWEIDIDDESFERYKRDGIACISEDETPHFVLNGDRCPYLNHDNLCELIIAHGEDYLCQICTDHPRFRNFWTDATEIGLGLCCEEAARLILGRKEPIRLFITDSTSGQEISYESFLEMLPEDEQYLFDIRDQLLEQAAQYEDTMVARLMEYLIYRHLPDALYDDRLEERILFCQRVTEQIAAQWQGLGFEERCEIARAFSDKVEYDTELMESYLDNC